MTKKLPRIVFLDYSTIAEKPDFSEIQEFGDLEAYAATSENEIIERVGHVDVIITSKVKITKNVIDACKSLRFIIVAATGMNNIDLEYALRKNIGVYNVKDYSTNSVVQITFSMIFRLISNLRSYEQYVLNGEYSQSSLPSCQKHSFREIAGKTFGIIGLGQIGKKVASIAEAFGMKVIYYSTSGLNNKSPQYESVSLDHLFCNSDIISIHCPLNTATDNLVTGDLLGLMKKNAVIINTARGGIINEKDLLSALKVGNIGGAGIDVFTVEPLPSDHPYLSYKGANLVLTPHIGWSSNEAKANLIAGIAKNIREHL